MDNYYCDISHLPVEERAKTNFDHPNALDITLLAEHLGQLRRGQTVDIPMYDFTTHSRRAETERVKPGRVILVEGILLLSDVRLRKMLDASAATLSSSRACERVNVRTDAAGLRF